MMHNIKKNEIYNNNNDVQQKSCTLYTRRTAREVDDKRNGLAQKRKKRKRGRKIGAHGR